MTPERKQEIANATAENPVRLTQEEAVELAAENKNRFQHDVGAGLYILPVTDGSRAAKMHAKKDAGLSDAEIAAELEISEDTVTRVLEHSYI